MQENYACCFPWRNENGKEIKNLNLVGDVYNLTLYMHGDASLTNTIFTLAAEFRDNLNPITITGQHGSLRDEKPFLHLVIFSVSYHHMQIYIKQMRIFGICV